MIVQAPFWPRSKTRSSGEENEPPPLQESQHEPSPSAFVAAGCGGEGDAGLGVALDQALKEGNRELSCFINDDDVEVGQDQAEDLVEKVEAALVQAVG